MRAASGVGFDGAGVFQQLDQARLSDPAGAKKRKPGAPVKLTRATITSFHRACAHGFSGGSGAPMRAASAERFRAFEIERGDAVGGVFERHVVGDDELVEVLVERLARFGLDVEQEIIRRGRKYSRRPECGPAR